MWHELLERCSTYLDARDIATAIVAAFILFLVNQARKWVMSKRNKLAAGVALVVIILLIVLAVWKYAVVMNVATAVFTFKVNIWLLVGAYALLTIAVGPWFIKNIHKIAADIGGARSEVFIQEGKALLDKSFDWLAQSDASNQAHGAFKVIQLQDRPFYELECMIDYSPAAIPKLSFGILLREERIDQEPNFKELSDTDVYAGVDLFVESFRARILEGGSKRAFRKGERSNWKGGSPDKRSVHIQFVINDGCNLALLIDGQFQFAKPVHKASLRHLALMVHTRPSASFKATIRNISIRVAKSEFDVMLERGARQLHR
jgi:hypothetical protein